MKTNCNHCNAEIHRKPSAIKIENYCDKHCRKAAKWFTGKCGVCSKEFQRHKCAVKDENNVFCSLKCNRIYTSERMTGMNVEMNPERMVPETRAKLRASKLRPNATSYSKLYGRHEHRIVAEQMLGRALRPGEVVHHIDENKRNNHPSNLIVFPSQAMHARWHKIVDSVNEDFKDYVERD